MYRNRNRNKFINQIRAPGGHIQITIMIDTQQKIHKEQLVGDCCLTTMYIQIVHMRQHSKS